MPSITTSDSVRLDYVESGNPAGRPVLLLAGFKAAATSWRYQARALEKAGFRVFALDSRGHGRSEKPTWGHRMARRAKDLEDFFVALDLTNVAMVGGSMGGNTLWAYLSLFGSERVAGVMIVDQTPKMLNADDWPHGYYGFTRENMGTFFEHSIPETGVGTPLVKRGMRLVRILRALDIKPGQARVPLDAGELELLFDHAQSDWRDVIRQLDIPALFVAGADSELWPSSHASSAAALNEHARFVVIENAGHPTNIEQPKAFNSAMLAFLDSLPRSGRHAPD